jgi:protein phosphatase
MCALQIRFASHQSRGERQYQHDSAGALHGRPSGAADGAAVFALADGVGSDTLGGVASRLAVDTVLTRYPAATGSTAMRLRQCLDHANAAIAAVVAAGAERRGAGCTLVCAAISTDGLEWISVGDSPLWLYRDGQLRRLNADHSMAPVFATMVAEGMMTRAEARSDAKRHVLRSALTGEAIRLIDTPP